MTQKPDFLPATTIDGRRRAGKHSRTERRAVGWMPHVLATGAAGLAALAADTALRFHLGASSLVADGLAALVFAGLATAHVALQPRPVRVAPRHKADPNRPAKVAEFRATAAVSPRPVAPPVAATTPSSSRDVARPVPANDFEYLQSLIAELARSTPGPKATTPDPDAPIVLARPAHADAIERARWTPAPQASDAVSTAAAVPVRASAALAPWGGEAGLTEQLEDALAAGRLTVYLEPIQQIDRDQARHYEVSVSFKTVDGRELPHRSMLAAARDAGLLPRVDAAVLPRAARIAQHFQSRGRDTEILSHVHGASLPDQDFRAEVTAATIAAEGAALVLSFAQDDVRGFAAIHWEILSTIADMGLRFAIEDVTDLDMDLGGLKRRGFDFVKLDASVLLDGLPAGSETIASADVCRHFAAHGLALIVNHIDDDAVRARLLGFGVLFGQGTLFGARRAVRADILSMPAAA